MRQFLFAPLFCLLLVAPAFGQEFLSDIDEVKADLDSADVPYETSEKVIVFIDPGHGGSDLGGRSPDLVLEKNITLSLSRIIKRKLETDKRIEVVASRFDDRKLSMIERVELANGSKARLFLSLHAASSDMPVERPYRIFIHKPDRQVSDGQVPWETLNDENDKQNKKFAALISEALASKTGGAMEVIATNRLFLGGLQMPAILIQPIDLSNPDDQMQLMDHKYQQELGRLISRGIIRFITSSGYF